MAGKLLNIPVKVISTDGDSAYAAHQKIYPREVGGLFQRLRNAAVFWLLGMYYLFPWINWDGRQMVLFDLPARKFYILGLVFWPQDFFYLSALLIVAALSLFFFTAIAGRLWCGFACPQTVWTEVFLWIERKIEGDRNARIRLDKGPWSPRKLRLKAAKQFVWIVLALWTGFTFVGFFTPIRSLGVNLIHFQLGGWEWFWFLFYSLATYGNAGLLREQVCKYMCPYARFQSAMIDNDTLIVTYDVARGEPRGARKRAVKSVAERTQAQARTSGLAQTLSTVAEDSAGLGLEPVASSMSTGVIQPSVISLGDCIQCKACVQVCPTGIDIRDGLQYECIGCAACVDACDEIMDKVGYPRGLVRFDTQHAIDGKPTRIIRKRTVFYAFLLTAIISALLHSLATRIPLLVDVIRDRGELYRETANASIENSYQVKIMNKTEAPRGFQLSLVDPPGLRIVGATQVQVPAGAIINLPVTLEAQAGAFKGMQRIRLRVTATDDPLVERIEDSRFFAP